MSTDNPVTESDVSIESRMAAVFGAEEAEQPEAAAAEPEPVSTDEPTTEVQEEVQASEDAATGSVDFETDDGRVIKIPAELEPYVSRTRDYTQKAMQAAELRKQAEDRLQYAEAREQITTAVLGDITELRSLESELKQYAGADWKNLEMTPGQAMAYQQYLGNLKDKIAEKKAEIQGKAQHLTQAAEKHNANQWQMAEQAARGIIGTITAAENIAMARTVEVLGITPQEFKSRFADPRIIALTHKAAKWDALQAGKPGAIKAASAAPPVVKPGASKGPGVASDQKYRDTRTSLKKSGSVQDAAKLFLMRGM